MIRMSVHSKCSISITFWKGGVVFWVVWLIDLVGWLVGWLISFVFILFLQY